MLTQHTATREDLGPAINVVTWFLGAMAFLAVLARTVTKRILSRIAADDYLVVAALVPCLGMSVTTAFATRNGLGQNLDGLTGAQRRSFQQAVYAGQLLYVLVLVLSKLSILFFLRTITPVSLHKLCIFYLSIFILAWGVSGLLATAFQCEAPEVWRFLARKQCIQRLGFSNYFYGLNILLEMILIIIPTAIVWSLQLGLRRKVVIAGCFFTRTLVIAVAIPELIFLNGALRSANYTYDAWHDALCVQLVQSLSIITACIPYLKPFFASLQTGMIRNDDLRRRDGGKASGYYGSGTSPKKPLQLHVMDNLGLKYGRSRTTVEGGMQDETESQASRSKMIRQTTTWEVQSGPLENQGS